MEQGLGRASEEARRVLEGLWRDLGCPGRKDFYPVSYPKKLVRAAELQGWKVDGVDGLRASPSGAQKLGGCNVEKRLITYNSKAIGGNAGRRNFTIAHELGHALLGHPSDKCIGPDYDREKDDHDRMIYAVAALADPADAYKEREADIFARDLLMPAKAVLREFASLCPGGAGSALEHEEIVQELARFFEVSRAAMRRRISEVCFVTQH